MSVPVVLIILSVLAIILSPLLLSKSGDFFFVGMIASMVLTISIILSFINPHGVPTVTDTSVFRLEKTPYRLIVTAFGKETVYTDAYTVAQADKVVAVRQTLPKNVWGIDMTAFMTITPVFHGETK